MKLFTSIEEIAVASVLVALLMAYTGVSTIKVLSTITALPRCVLYEQLHTTLFLIRLTANFVRCLKV
jgi:hypothetical protein